MSGHAYTEDPARRAARHRAVRGAGLADGVGIGGSLWRERHARARDEGRGGVGSASAGGAGAAESRAAAGGDHGRHR